MSYNPPTGGGRCLQNYTFGKVTLPSDSVETGASFTFSVSVTFVKADIADGLTTHLYQSAAGESNADTDTGVSDNLGVRSASTADLTLEGTAPNTVGTYQYRLCIAADTSVCSATMALTVEAPVAPTPLGDRFTVGDLTADDSTKYEGVDL